MRFPKIIRHRKAEATIYGKRPGYPYYRVTWQANGRRLMKSCSTYSDAKAKADKVVRDLAKGSQAPALSPQQALDAIAAFGKLDELYRTTGRRFSLLAVVGEIAGTTVKLGGAACVAGLVFPIDGGPGVDESRNARRDLLRCIARGSPNSARYACPEPAGCEYRSTAACSRRCRTAGWARIEARKAVRDALSEENSPAGWFHAAESLGRQRRVACDAVNRRHGEFVGEGMIVGRPNLRQVVVIDGVVASLFTQASPRPENSPLIAGMGVPTRSKTCPTMFASPSLAGDASMVTKSLPAIAPVFAYWMPAGVLVGNFWLLSGTALRRRIAKSEGTRAKSDNWLHVLHRDRFPEQYPPDRTPSARSPRCHFFALIVFIPQQGEQNATRSPFARIKFIRHGKPMNKGLP